MSAHERLVAWQRSHEQGPREFRRFLDIALGSLGELNYLLRLATDLAILTPTDPETLTRLRTATGGTLWPLYRSILQAATPTGPSRPPHPPY